MSPWTRADWHKVEEPLLSPGRLLRGVSLWFWFKRRQGWRHRHTWTLGWYLRWYRRQGAECHYHATLQEPGTPHADSERASS